MTKQFVLMHHKLLFILSIFALAFFCSLPSKAQQKAIYNPVTTSIEAELPPLSVLIDSALIKSPLLARKDKQVAIKRLAEISAKRKWLDFATIDLQFGFGKYDNLTAGNLNTYATVTSSNQTRYAVGASIKMPLYDVFTYFLNNKIAKEETVLAQFEAKEAVVSIRELVIRQYNDLVLAQKLLLIKNENVQSVQTLNGLAQKQFAAGSAELDKVTQIQQTLSKAREELAKAQNSFVITYLLLQETTGIKFNIL